MKCLGSAVKLIQPFSGITHEVVSQVSCTCHSMTLLTDHVVILSMGTLTKWMGVRKLVAKTTLYSPYNPKCVIFHNHRATDATEESLLHSTLEADNSNFG